MNAHFKEHLKGIFTLGESSKAVIEEINGLKGKNEDFLNKNGQKTKILEKNEIEFVTKLKNFQEKCWQQKGKYDADFKEAFTGGRKSKTAFKEMVLQKYMDYLNSVVLQNKGNHPNSLDDLKRQAQTILNETPKSVEPLYICDLEKIVILESHEILKKQIVGKEHVSVAPLIQRLSNSDWVQEGRKYFQDNICPFCQQKTISNLADLFDEYFDETFKLDIQTIEETCSEYRTAVLLIREDLEYIDALQSPFLDSTHLQSVKMAFDVLAKENLLLLDAKKKEPSRSIQLASTTDVLSQVKSIIAEANRKIQSHNQVVVNLAQEKE